MDLFVYDITHPITIWLIGIESIKRVMPIVNHNFIICKEREGNIMLNSNPSLSFTIQR